MSKKTRKIEPEHVRELKPDKNKPNFLMIALIVLIIIIFLFGSLAVPATTIQ